MINQKIEHFSFWTPVTFDQKTPGTHFLTTLAWHIGSFSDQLTYLGKQTLQVKAERIDAHKIYFETAAVKQIPLWQTALKASLCSLTLFMVYTAPVVAIVPTFILTAKIIFKLYLNRCKTSTQKSPNMIIGEKRFGNTKVVLLTGDLMTETTDAIVNPANRSLKAGGGVCGVIQANAGDEPFNECAGILRKLNRDQLECGQAVLTQAGNLKPRIKYIIHAPGPDCRVSTENADRSRLLRETYNSSLNLAINPASKPRYISSSLDAQSISRSVAFPSISTGIFKYPLQEAANTAIETIKAFIRKNPDALDEVRFVFLPLDQDSNQTAIFYQKALGVSESEKKNSIESEEKTLEESMTNS